MSNLPAGADRVTHSVIVCRCRFGHQWEPPVYSELGGVWFVDEERGPFCPVCHYVDVDSCATSALELGEPMSGYVSDHGIWRMPDHEPELEPVVLCDECREGIVLDDSGHTRHERDGVDADHRPRSHAASSLEP